jgi:hypothetical protein
VNHHPAFIAELNRLRAQAALRTYETARRVTGAAIAAVEKAIAEGNVDVALRWLRMGTLEVATRLPGGAMHSWQVVEEVRRGMGSPLDDLRHSHERSVSDAEALITRRLSDSGVATSGEAPTQGRRRTPRVAR